jgi:hypothetical protein
MVAAVTDAALGPNDKIVLIDWEDTVNAYRIMAGCARCTDEEPFDLDAVLPDANPETLCATYVCLLCEFAVSLWQADVKEAVRQALAAVVNEPHTLCHVLGMPPLFSDHEVHTWIHGSGTNFAKDMLCRLDVPDARLVTMGCDWPEHTNDRDVEFRMLIAVTFLCTFVFPDPDPVAADNFDALAELVAGEQSPHPAWAIHRPDLYEDA